MGHGPWSAWLLGCEKPIELGVSRITQAVAVRALGFTVFVSVPESRMLWGC